MADTVIFYEKNEAVISAGFTGNRISSLNIEEKENIYKIGNVYVGRVTKILLHLKAAYIDIGMKKPCFMELKDGFKYLTDFVHPDGDIHVGDEVVVQISKQPYGSKPATVTPFIEVVGRNVIVTYSCSKSKVAFSSKFNEAVFKKDIKAKLTGQIPNDYSVLVRTNAAAATYEKIEEEYNRKKAELDKFLEGYRYKNKGDLLWESEPEYIVAVRDGKGFDCNKIMTDSPDIYIRLKDYLGENQPDLLPALSFYSDNVLSLEALYDMRKHLSETVSEKVWLKSGAQLVIQTTEALTSIDINTSKASAEIKNFKDGYMKINLEATNEIKRQILLRNISGIIIIDYINDKAHSKTELFERVKEIMADTKEIQVVDITKLGLIELTRKRTDGANTEMIKRYKLNL